MAFSFLQQYNLCTCIMYMCFRALKALFRNFLQIYASLLFTVSTPWGKEFHQPHITTVQNHAVKVIISQLYNIFLIATTAATRTLKSDKREK